MNNKKAGKYACYEFERKFLLTGLPANLKSSSECKQIEDRYFVGTNLRLRIVRSLEGKIVDRKLTQKFVPKDGDLSKTSITNLYLRESEMKLLSQLQGRVLKRKRYKLSHDNQTFSVDEFLEPFTHLVSAEIEFESEEKMNSFVVPFPDWKEVSLDIKYSGGYLAIERPRND
ncbi:MAG: hypothetical protein IPL83_17765 [Bdellovibrionales bacterium]|nr:hypothetical protein [Bdellovibrionales bacterium]